MSQNKQMWKDAMRRQGHLPTLDDWNDIPDIDMFAMSYEFCNGPRCSICYWSTCVNCNSDMKIPKCEAVGKRAYWFNNWITQRNFENSRYQKFTKENKLRIINEIRELYGKEKLNGNLTKKTR